MKTTCIATAPSNEGWGEGGAGGASNFFAFHTHPDHTHALLIKCFSISDLSARLYLSCALVRGVVIG